MTIHSYSYQDKQAIMKHLAFLYSRQYVILHYYARKITHSTCIEYEGANHFVELIEGILELLTKEHKEILVNDFFHQKERDWWTKYYSKTTYYRIKSTAMNEFLHCL